VEREPAQHCLGASRGPAAGRGVGADPFAVDGDERELGGDEQRGGADESQDGQQAERGVDDRARGRSGSRVRPCECTRVTTGQAVLAAVIVAVGAAVQGAVGFGANLVAAPLLVLIYPGLVPGPITVAALALNTLIATRERAHADVRELRIASIALVPGTIAGAAALAATDDRSLGLLLAAIVLLGVALTASGLRVPARPHWIAGAGALSGFMGTAAAIGGPPLALLHQHREGPVIRATLARLFIVSALLAVLGLLAFDRFGVDELRLGLLLIPGALVGASLSGPAARALDRGYMRRAILVLSTVSAAVLVATKL
jgi:uncharacterized membrane protein YfcA